jgi:hypothetical protein
MDPITHSLVGGLAAKTVGTTKRRFWVMMFLGTAPDLDVLFNGLGSWAFWLQHRGISHSILGIVVQTLLYAWIFQKWDVGSYRQRAWHYFLPLFLHSFCGFTKTTVSIIEKGALSVAVSALPALPKTLTTSGIDFSFLSIFTISRSASATEMPGRVVGI